MFFGLRVRIEAHLKQPVKNLAGVGL